MVRFAGRMQQRDGVTLTSFSPGVQILKTHFPQKSLSQLTSVSSIDLITVTAFVVTLTLKWGRARCESAHSVCSDKVKRLCSSQDVSRLVLEFV